MTLTVNGVDFIPYVAKGGFKWKRNDVESPNSGRTVDGVMQRDRVASKIRLDITCRPLKSDELNIVLNTIFPEYVTVEYDDPMMGNVILTMYSNNNPAQFLLQRQDGTEWWNGITFPLIER